MRWQLHISVQQHLQYDLGEVLAYREDMCQLLEESLEESPKKFLAFHLLTLRLQHRRSLKTS